MGADLHHVLLHAGHATESTPSGPADSTLLLGGIVVFLAIVGLTWYLAR